MKALLTHLFFATVAVLAPIQAVLLSVGFLIIADLVTGVWAARKRGEPITSAALRRTISKMLIYQLCIISGHLVEHNLMNDAVPVTKLIASVIGLVELKSLLENANGILGVDIFRELVKRLGSKNDTLK